MRYREEQGLIELFASPEPNMKDIDEQLRRDALAYLPDHLRRVISQRGSLRPLDDVEAVYGDMLGRARVTHVRGAITDLHRAGALDAGGGGDFWLRTYRWIG